MNKIILVGGGGHCLSVIDSIERENQYEILGIIDIEEKVGLKVGGYPIIGTDSDLNKYYQQGIKYAFISLGSVDLSCHRKKLNTICKSIGFIMPTIKDPSAVIASDVKVGEGTYIGKGVILNKEAIIGENSILNTGSIVEHNSEIGDCTHISPGVIIAGNVSVGNYTHIGLGTKIIQNITIGSNVFIGSSSNVVHDILDNYKAYGNPCRMIEKR